MSASRDSRREGPRERCVRTASRLKRRAIWFEGHSPDTDQIREVKENLNRVKPMCGGGEGRSFKNVKPNRTGLKTDGQS